MGKTKKYSPFNIAKDPNAYMTLLKDINFCNELAGFIDSLEFEALDGVTMIIECNINIDDIIPTHYWNVTKPGSFQKKIQHDRLLFDNKVVCIKPCHTHSAKYIWITSDKNCNNKQSNKCVRCSSRENRQYHNIIG